MCVFVIAICNKIIEKSTCGVEEGVVTVERLNRILKDRRVEGNKFSMWMDLTAKIDLKFYSYGANKHA